MDPMVSGGERWLVVTDGCQSLRGGYRRLRLCRWIEVVEVQAAAQTNFMTDHLVHVALNRREFVQVYVELVERQMWRAHYLSDYGSRHVVILLVVQHVVERYTLLRRKKVWVKNMVYVYLKAGFKVLTYIVICTELGKVQKWILQVQNQNPNF